MVVSITSICTLLLAKQFRGTVLFEKYKEKAFKRLHLKKVNLSKLKSMTKQFSIDHVILHWKSFCTYFSS